jgi:hypothetical protein
VPAAVRPVGAVGNKEGRTVKDSGRLLWLGVGLLLGGLAVALWLGHQPQARAANDRYDDYIMCTGTVKINPAVQTDGIWLLDYRAGKLLGTVVDRTGGKIMGWAEVDLVNEFGLPPRQNVHFLMTCGQITVNQAALYVAETTSGKFGVYTMAARPDGQPGIVIKRHDLVMFRQAHN